MKSEIQNKDSEKQKFEKGIKIDVQNTEMKFELGYFECSISSINLALKSKFKVMQTAIERN